MELLREIRFGNWLLMIYGNGITLWRGQNAEFTFYDSLLLTVSVLAAMSVLLLMPPRFRLSSRLDLLRSIHIVVVVGGAALLLSLLCSEIFPYGPSIAFLIVALVGFAKGPGRWPVPSRLLFSLGIVSLAGGGAMWLGATTASRLSGVSLVLTVLGFLMGAGTFGVCVGLSRLLQLVRAAKKPFQPTCRGMSPPSG